jgi:hypothetical protein
MTTEPTDAELAETEDEPDFYDCGNCYGNGCSSCHHTGRIESQSHRERREDYLDRKADAIRKGEW